MPIFVCDKCGCMENTALGFYWARLRKDMWEDKSLQDKALCSECAPPVFSNGSKSGHGQWHDKFPKRQWDGKREVINRKELLHATTRN